MSIPGFEKIVRTEFERAGIKKPAKPYILRHSRATHLAKFLTESQLCPYFGWVQCNNVVRKYVHLSGRDVDNAVLQASGFAPRAWKKNRFGRSVKNRDQLTPSEALHRCRELISPSSSFCAKRGLSTTSPRHTSKK